MGSQQWAERVVKNRLPVMAHLWSETFAIPSRSLALAAVIDDIMHEFEGRMEAVRHVGPGSDSHTATHAPPYAHASTSSVV